MVAEITGSGKRATIAATGKRGSRQTGVAAGISRRIEDKRPVDPMAWRDGLKSQQVWKHRHSRRTVLKKIAMSDLPLSVAIRRIREPERDERHLGSVVTAIAHQNLPGHLRSD